MFTALLTSPALVAGVLIVVAGIGVWACAHRKALRKRRRGEVRWCAIGEHWVYEKKGWRVERCANCGASFCPDHKGDLAIPPGGLLSCPSCVVIVGEVNTGRRGYIEQTYY